MKSLCPPSASTSLALDSVDSLGALAAGPQTGWDQCLSASLE